MDRASSGPAVVASVLERTVEETSRRIRAAPVQCSLVELRADYLSASTTARAVREANRPLIVTVRRKEEGGCFRGSEEQRRGILIEALRAGAHFIDVERGSSLADLAEGKHAARTMLSDHGAPCRPDVLGRLYGEMKVSRAARLKIVPRATHIGEILAVRELLALRKRERPLACFASGSEGAITRLLAPSWGSWGTYGSARRGAQTAEGQFTARDLLDTYSVGSIGPETVLFGLVGSRVLTSPSPAMHGAGYRASGLNARYVPLQADRFDDVRPLLGPTGGLGIAALAVTMPFKQELGGLTKPCDAASRLSGAVNTVLLDGPQWRGYNTDGPAALLRIRQRMDPAGKRVAIIGAGGTARALAVVLHQAGATVVLYNRNAPRGREVARSLGLPVHPLERLVDAVWDILVNATPLGAAGEEVLPQERLRGELVLDAVYAPEETPLVRQSRDSGIDVIDGTEMLAAQAVLQFERMTGCAASHDVFRAVALQRLRLDVP